jgi:hypothetical protein
LRALKREHAKFKWTYADQALALVAIKDVWTRTRSRGPIGVPS